MKISSFCGCSPDTLGKGCGIKIISNTILYIIIYLNGASIVSSPVCLEIRNLWPVQPIKLQIVSLTNICSAILFLSNFLPCFLLPQNVEKEEWLLIFFFCCRYNTFLLFIFVFAFIVVRTQHMMYPFNKFLSVWHIIVDSRLQCCTSRSLEIIHVA